MKEENNSVLKELRRSNIVLSIISILAGKSIFWI